MMDGSWNYNYEQALRVGFVLQELKFFGMRIPRRRGHLQLCQTQKLLAYSDDEHEHVPGGLYAQAEWVMQRATDLLREM